MLVVLLAPLTAAPSAAALREDPRSVPTAPVVYEPPVPGSVLRGFEPPSSRYGAGHRGVDLRAAPGEAVRAAGAGEVRFAGAVAGIRWVTVVHADGVSTSYGPLAASRVVPGQRVGRGQVVATLAAGGHGHGSRDAGLHWGARVEGRYIDPLELLGGVPPRPSLVGPGDWSATDRLVTPYRPWGGGRAGGALVGSSPTAARPGYATAPNPNHVVMLPGLASSSETRVLDGAHLGYAPESVTAFSYAGRTDGLGPAHDPHRDQLPHRPADTWQGTGPAAAQLADQLRAQAAREPGRAVDLVGHSMGGVVILRYLVEHHDAYDPSLPPIGNVVTIGAPLRGSDLAAAWGSVEHDPLVGPLGLGLQRWLAPDRLALDAPAIGELAVGSEALGELGHAWQHARDGRAAGPLAMGTRILTIAGATDPVVAADRARLPSAGEVHRAPQPDGAPPSDHAERRRAQLEVGDELEVDVAHRVLPGGHAGVLRTEAVHETTWRFLAGEEVVDSPGYLSTVVGEDLGTAVRSGAEAYRWWSTLAYPVRQLLRRPTPTVPVP